MNSAGNKKNHPEEKLSERTNKDSRESVSRGVDLDLNEKQKEAAEHRGGPLLIVAGAGSGKTRTLVSRLIYLLETGVKPENIIAITFTNKAADEMRDRIKKYEYNAADSQPFIGTFHSLGARILREEGRFLGRSANFTIFDADDSQSLIKKTLKKFNFPEKEKITLPAASRAISRFKNELLSAEEAGDEKIQAVLEDYEKELQRNNAFDFDDLIEKPVRLFNNNPLVLEKYQNLFRHILVDEYQDTNTAQYYFVKFLSRKHRNVSVVGDDAQSIFKFRGSDFRNFLNFENDWQDAKVVLLEENYRSTANIIKAASAVIARNKYQKPKKLWTKNSGGEPIKVIEHQDAEEEAQWIAGKISDFKTFSRPVGVPPAGEADSGQMPNYAILYRTNAQSRAMEQALIEEGIPYSIFGGIRFYERKEIKDVVAALRYGVNPQDGISRERLEKNFPKSLARALLEDIPQKARELSPVEFIGYFLKSTDYFEYLKKHYLNYEERTENIASLIEFSSQFQNMEELTEKITLLQSTDNIKKKNISQYDGLVSLMTIHLAKGLEFDKVFVVGANDGLLPHQMSYANDEEIEEERRLMYVAMTRAKKELFLNFYDLPSRFLHEIPPELVEFAGRKKFSLNEEERWIEY